MVSNIAAVAVNIVGVKQCFKEGTLVACLDEEGNEIQKPIETIAVGTLVLAYDETTGEKAYKPVVQLFRNTTKEWYHIFVNGEEIVCTGGHPFYVANLDKFIPAKELKISDKLLLSNGKTVIIDSIEIETLATPETTYNFEVADFHTYYVTDSNILVHNKCNEEIYFDTQEEAQQYFDDVMGSDSIIYDKTKYGNDIYMSSDGLRYGYLDTSHHRYGKLLTSPDHYNIDFRNMPGKAGKVVKVLHIFYGKE